MRSLWISCHIKSLAKNVSNRLTDVVLLHSEASYRPKEGLYLFWGRFLNPPREINLTDWVHILQELFLDYLIYGFWWFYAIFLLLSIFFV